MNSADALEVVKRRYENGKLKGDKYKAIKRKLQFDHEDSENSFMLSDVEETEQPRKKRKTTKTKALQDDNGTKQKRGRPQKA